METNSYEKRHTSKRGSMVAFILIAFGFLLLGRNLGWIDSYFFHLILSWPMLFILGGILAIFRRHLVGGAFAIGIGLYFLFPKLNWITHGWIHTYWPLGLVVLGVIVLLKRRDNRYTNTYGKEKSGFFAKRSFASSVESSSSAESGREGYVHSHVSFSSVKHIVRDPVFRGAHLDISFGGLVLDVRHTVLETPETVIYIDCSFGGVELYVPEHWLIRLETDAFLSGCDDHRGRGQQIDPDHVLIIRGNLTLSGIQIKS